MGSIMITRFASCLALLMIMVTSAPAADITWGPWSKDLFDRAKASNKFVLLDLEAVWCHWCHVMAATTYKDPKVTDLIAARYIPVRVDQDANPELSARYGDWGWPATIVFAPDGTEIVKLPGYRSPEAMASLLQAIIDDPSPGPSAFTLPDVTPASAALLPAAKRAEMLAGWQEGYDKDNGGWGDVHRFLPADAMDLTLSRVADGDKAAETMARQTLDANLKLLDPVWGGVYQYSDKLDWSSPHYEKIMSYQASNMRQYAQGFARWQTPSYLAAADGIRRYLTGMMMSPDGAFYTSQDADLSLTVPGRDFYSKDDAGRRALGMPRIDRHVYARENGWVISGLAALYSATGDAAVLAEAERAHAWIVANRSLPGGGFSHDAGDRGGPFLGDSVAMGQASLDLYMATGNRQRLLTAIATGQFIVATFRLDAGGFVTTKTDVATVGAFAKPVVQFDEMAAATRFFNRLNRTSGKAEFRAAAEHGMRWLGSDVVTELPGYSAGVLLADAEVGIEPMHVTVVGAKQDAKALQLHRAALALPADYRRIDWWDVSEGPMDNPDVQYPPMETAAAFACSNRICSEPVSDAAQLAKTVARMLAIRKPAP